MLIHCLHLAAQPERSHFILLCDTLLSGDIKCIAKKLQTPLTSYTLYTAPMQLLLTRLENIRFGFKIEERLYSRWRKITCKTVMALEMARADFFATGTAHGPEPLDH